MEHVLEERPNKFAAAASLFAIPAFDRFFGPLSHLLISGENDPVVAFSTIQKNVEKSDVVRVQLISYPDEGYWFRKPKNMEQAITAILGHYCKNQ